MSIILHDYWRSSSAYRVRIAPNLLGLENDTVPVDLTKVPVGSSRRSARLIGGPKNGA
jgi:maleylacetoacetate isomerase